MMPASGPAGAATLDHFREPRNVGSFAPDTPGVGRGMAGSAAGGDMIKMALRIERGRIQEARFQAFGCASAIASASLATERVRGLAIDAIAELDPGPLARELELAPDKTRFAALAVAAVQAALADWRGRHGEP